MTHMHSSPQFFILNPPVLAPPEESVIPSTMWQTAEPPVSSPNNEPPNEPYQPDPTNCVRIRTNQEGNPANAQEPPAAGRFWVMPGTGASCRHERYVYSRPIDINDAVQFILGSVDNGRPWTVNTDLLLTTGLGLTPSGVQPTDPYKTANLPSGRAYRKVDCDTKKIITFDDMDEIIVHVPIGPLDSTYPGTPENPDFTIWRLAVPVDFGQTVPPFYSLVRGLRSGATARFVEWGTSTTIRVTEVLRGPTGHVFRPGETIEFGTTQYTRQLSYTLNASAVVPPP